MRRHSPRIFGPQQHRRLWCQCAVPILGIVRCWPVERQY